MGGIAIRPRKLSHLNHGEPGMSREKATATTPIAFPGGWKGETLAVAFLVALHLALGLSAAATKSITYDELPHLTAGTAYWQNGDYRLHCENGNLPQRWCAAPGAWLGNAKLPDATDPAWRDADVWTLGDRFLHGGANDFRQLLLQGRFAAALWGVAIGLLVYFWSRSLFGAVGGLISLACCSLCPTLLANGPLMTSDACTAFFLLASVGAVWRVLHRISPLIVALAVATICGLFLTKFSAVLLVPIALLLVGIRLYWGKELPLSGPSGELVLHSRWLQALAISGVALLAFLGAWRAVWLAYGDRFTPQTAVSESYFKLGTLATACKYVPARPRAVLQALAATKALPEPYLYGGAFVLAHRQRASYFLGNYSTQGSAWFFPFCFAVKTPLPALALIALGCCALFGRTNRSRWYFAAPLVVLAGVYAAVSVAASLNIGHRHLLPLYPPLYILVGAVATRFADWRWLRFAVLGCLSLTAIDTLSAWPNFLAYFNPVVPRSQAYRMIVDSSLDWGQDLPGLAAWLEKNRGHTANGKREPVYLAYFGKGSPVHYGIDAPLLPRLPEEPVFDFEAGLYCVSATRLAAIYDRPAGPWNETFERDYQRFRAQEQAAREKEPFSSAAKDARNQLDQYRYLRLLSYLRQREPQANVGGSILVFRLSQKDVAQALEGPPAEREEMPWLEREKQARQFAAAKGAGN